MLNLLIRDDEKRKAEFGCGRLLSDHFHTDFEYVASDIKMKDKSGRDLGDIDTLYIAKDFSRVALLERKRSASANASSVAELMDQLRATKRAFMDQATVFLVPADWRRSIATASVISVVYCKAGPDSLFRILTSQGIHAATDSVEFFAPSQAKRP